MSFPPSVFRERDRILFPFSLHEGETDFPTIMCLVLLIHIPEPNSFTGEDILELQCQGGMLVMDMLLEH